MSRRTLLFLPALALYPLLQLLPHGWMLHSLLDGPADPAAVAFVAAALGADLIFGWLMVGFALAKGRALQVPTRTGPTARVTTAATVLIPVCDEPIDVLRPTFRAADRLGHRVLVVENSRTPGHGDQVRTLADAHGLDWVAVPNRGTKAAALNAALPLVETELLVLFDADVVATSDAVGTLVAPLLEDPRLALVQSPQAERNREASVVAAAASCQQLYFYEFVAQGWGALGLALCVGTNCALRVGPLRAVGGFPEDTVTEDVALSYSLHRAGHRSRFLPEVVGWGLAPETLPGFWRQRARHAEGAIHLLLRALGDRGGPLRLRVAYATMAAFPLVAVGYLCFAVTVLLAASVDIASWSRDLVYLGAAGAFVATQVLLLSGLRGRGHRLVEALAGQGGTLMVLPAYLLGTARALVRRPAFFAVTPKGDTAVGPWPRRLAVAATLLGALWAVRWATLAWNTELGVGVFTAWVVFHVVVLLAPWGVAARRAPTLTAPTVA